ncbi:hypothetical protein Daura_02365 [Dactylosporangium aurantiacum]|uniref:Secreted protein n=1 Tax=Dactylosporangium aurantiacum TaxID=35754 RepID=A0A9Q9IGJ6_9ACTN|nr:hypothetical protein [Dactylosporangium aurantiacum]MDG6100790.1 hypothetical protein [Dactylosporangium aurantiacum]UWZ55146.1 hypothetical protein Daura_02365 [Dactylosporangium aurantiacum]
MNTWFRRAVGTVGVAGGILLLGAGAAHADDALVPGQLDDLFSPAGGPNNQSLQLEAHGSRIDTSAASSSQAGRRTTSTQVTSQQLPDVLSLLPTEMLGLPRTTSSKVANISAAPGRTLPTEDSVAALPLVGSLQQFGLPGVAGMPVAAGDPLRGASIADTRTAFPNVGAEATSLPLGNTAGGGLPLVGGLGGGTGALPLVGGLPVQGTLKPVDDFAIPLGGGKRSSGQRVQRVQSTQGVQGMAAGMEAGMEAGTEAGTGLPVVGDVPLGGSDVLKNDSVTGVPVIGGVGPTPGVSTTAVANRLVPTTGALPRAASQLPLVTEKTYAPRHAGGYRPRHAAAEALPVVGGLPMLNGIAGGNLPLVGGLLGGR